MCVCVCVCALRSVLCFFFGGEGGFKGLETPLPTKPLFFCDFFFCELFKTVCLESSHTTKKNTQINKRRITIYFSERKICLFHWCGICSVECILCRTWVVFGVEWLLCPSALVRVCGGEWFLSPRCHVLAVEWLLCPSALMWILSRRVVFVSQMPWF